jgi:nicotinate phosphoribosyltransferase
MMFAVLQKFPDLRVKYRFKDRNKQAYPKDFGYALSQQLQHMDKLSLTEPEAEFLQTKVKFLPKAFVDFLKGYRFDSSEVSIIQHDDGTLDIEIEGLWYRTILWEVPILAIISELFFKMTNQFPALTGYSNADVAKVTELQKHNAHFSDFGTRRRYSYANQDRIINLFSKVSDEHFTGTSNIHFAHKYKDCFQIQLLF